MALVNQGGSFLLQNGALATGAGCCCNKCSGPCDGENPCPEGCECVDGQCVDCPGCWRVLFECRYGTCFGFDNPFPDGGSSDVFEVKFTEVGTFCTEAQAQAFIDDANPADFYCDPFTMTGPDLFGQGFTDCQLTEGPTLIPPFECYNPLP
jgi:hypothetical protein